MIHTFQISPYNIDKIKKELISSEGKIKKNIELENKVEIIPRFTYIDSSKIIGSEDILLFYLSIPAGVLSGLVANTLYNWIVKNEVKKLRINKTVILIKENEKEKIIKIIIEEVDR